jgi:hypothetical protein
LELLHLSSVLVCLCYQTPLCPVWCNRLFSLLLWTCHGIVYSLEFSMTVCVSCL